MSPKCSVAKDPSGVSEGHAKKLDTPTFSSLEKKGRIPLAKIKNFQNLKIYISTNYSIRTGRKDFKLLEYYVSILNSLITKF